MYIYPASDLSSGLINLLKASVCKSKHSCSGTAGQEGKWLQVCIPSACSSSYCDSENSRSSPVMFDSVCPLHLLSKMKHSAFSLWTMLWNMIYDNLVLCGNDVFDCSMSAESPSPCSSSYVALITTHRARVCVRLCEVTEADRVHPHTHWCVEGNTTHTFTHTHTRQW